MLYIDVLVDPGFGLVLLRITQYMRVITFVMSYQCGGWPILCQFLVDK
jgi:hypothetical protein